MRGLPDRGSGSLALIILAALTIGACGGEDGSATQGEEYEFPAAPAVSGEPSLEEAQRAADAAIAAAAAGSFDQAALDRLAASGDARYGWLISDLMRFAQDGQSQAALSTTFAALTGVSVADDPNFALSPWQSVTNHLIAWDLPAPPGYRPLKGRLFTSLEPGWRPFFADSDSEIDFRLLSWGGVLIDDRPLGDPDPCPDGCIPALDDPPLTEAGRGDWYPDEALIFGIEIDGEQVAFPKNIMEVHEMVNITVGGRRLGIPYCTLCGSAQAYFTDRDSTSDGEDLVLRTSGLLSRSNKVMYGLGSGSVFDTFTGEALSGPLRERGVELGQATVVTTSWGEWKAEHPDTRIVAEDGGLGRSYPLDPLRGRDDDGPIFPIGDVDPRLPVQESVVGVINADGEAVAFPAALAREALAAGDPVTAAGVTLTDDAGGLRAEDEAGNELPSHQAFWFAWSQFHTETALWEPGGGA